MSANIENLANTDTVEVKGSHLAAMIYDAEYRLEEAQLDFKRVARYVITDLERAVERLEETGVTPNSLGVLQGRGPELDRLAGEIARLASTTRMLNRLAKKE